MFHIYLAMLLTVAVLAGCVTSSTAVTNPASTQDAVAATERAFAKSMADRDFKAFESFLSDEAIFMSGSTPLRGKQQVAAAWKAYFDSPAAPFSWEPERVVVLDSAGLAFSTGPVYGPDGAVIAIFNSVWRHDADGMWRIVFDKGGCACN